MFLISTHLGASPIEGVGVFASEPVAAGAAVWEFRPGLDLVLPPEVVAATPPAFRAYLERYAYPSDEVPAGHVVLLCDHAKFLNHAEDPNTGSRGPVSQALRPIAAGEELTCDYRLCCRDWPGFG